MDALEILNGFIDSGSAPDVLSREFPDGEDPVIRFGWFCGTRLDIPYNEETYDAVWNRFNEYWGGVKRGKKNDRKTICR